MKENIYTVKTYTRKINYSYDVLDAKLQNAIDKCEEFFEILNGYPSFLGEDVLKAVIEREKNPRELLTIYLHSCNGIAFGMGCSWDESYMVANYCWSQDFFFSNKEWYNSIFNEYYLTNNL